MSAGQETVGEIRSGFIRMGLPAAAAMFVGTLYAPVDLWCAGQLGTPAVVAIAFSAPLFFVLVAFSSGLSQASTALMAREVGAGNVLRAKAIWSHALALATTVGILLSCLSLWLVPLLLEAQGAAGVSLSLGVEFSTTLMMGAVCFMLVATINTALVVGGDTKPNFWFLLLGCLMNLVLNLLLMPHWGIVGLAASTVLVQVLGALGLYQVARGRGWQGGTVGAFRFETFKALIRQALPTVLNMMMIPVAIFLITRQVARFGPEAVAGYGFAARIEQLFSMPLIGFVTPVLPLAARAFGQKNFHLTSQVWLEGVKLALMAAVAVSVLLLLFGSNLATLSGLNGVALGHLQKYLIFAALALPAYPFLFSVVFLMQAVGKPEYGMWMGLGRHCLAPMLLLPLFVAWLGIDGVWVGILSIAWAAALVAFYIANQQRQRP
jgi:putative MATE family efflux protein